MQKQRASFVQFQHVIQTACRVQEHHGDSEYRNSQKSDVVSDLHRLTNHQHESDQRQQSSRKMRKTTHGIFNFLDDGYQRTSLVVLTSGHPEIVHYSIDFFIELCRHTLKISFTTQISPHAAVELDFRLRSGRPR